MQISQIVIEERSNLHRTIANYYTDNDLTAACMVATYLLLESINSLEIASKLVAGNQPRKDALIEFPIIFPSHKS
jgi:hypothetical protein